MAGYFGPLPAADTTQIIFGRKTSTALVGGLADRAGDSRRPSWMGPAIAKVTAEARYGKYPADACTTVSPSFR